MKEEHPEEAEKKVWGGSCGVGDDPRRVGDDPRRVGDDPRNCHLQSTEAHGSLTACLLPGALQQT